MDELVFKRPDEQIREGRFAGLMLTGMAALLTVYAAASIHTQPVRVLLVVLGGAVVVLFGILALSTARLQTVVNCDGIQVSRGILGTRRVPWSDFDFLEIKHGSSGAIGSYASVRAVTRSGGRVRLLGLMHAGYWPDASLDEKCDEIVAIGKRYCPHADTSGSL